MSKIVYFLGVAIYNLKYINEVMVVNDTEKQIVEILTKVRPYLQRDGGDVEYLKFEDGIVYVRMLGACAGCSSMDATLKDGIEQILLEEVPGVIGVENVEAMM